MGTSTAGGPGSIPDQGTRSHVLQLNVPSATTKTLSIQINRKTYGFKGI